MNYLECLLASLYTLIWFRTKQFRKWPFKRTRNKEQK